ncbi:protein ovarian tumor locus-like [Watersipora subatra]|uniref:protein ovarian tumor locus-like n=1 Tax=Watersipora subatra TaxID=2589382 RepID=UPI00355B9D85
MRVDQLERGSPVDVWLLNKHGLYRILISKDEECLYRAIAEQKCPSQNYYEKVKKKLNSYCSEHLETPGKSFESLNTPDEKMAVVSAAYRRNVLLYGKIDAEPKVFGKYGGTTITIMLRYDDSDDSYESIHPIEHMRQMALCQSLVYEVLYDKVFNISRDTQLDTVDKVRQKTYNRNQTQRRPLGGHSCSFYDTSIQSSSTVCSHKAYHSDEYEQCTDCDEFPPFPFRVAKSLDPAFYRNASYDIWLDARKDIKEGDKVTIRDPRMNEVTGHVQEILSDEKLRVFAQAPCGQLVVVNRSDIIKAFRKAPPKSAVKATVRPRPDKNLKSYPATPNLLGLNNAGASGFPLSSTIAVNAVLPQQQLTALRRQASAFQHPFQQAPANTYNRAGQQFAHPSRQCVQPQNAGFLASRGQPVPTPPQQPTFTTCQLQAQAPRSLSAFHTPRPLLSSYFIHPQQFPVSQGCPQQFFVMPPMQQFSRPDNAITGNQLYASMTHKASANASSPYNQPEMWSFGQMSGALSSMVSKPSPPAEGALQQQ